MCEGEKWFAGTSDPTNVLERHDKGEDVMVINIEPVEMKPRLGDRIKNALVMPEVEYQTSGLKRD